jgi:hypothetical protein
VFHVHSDETFTTFLKDTDKSTGGAIRRAILEGATKARSQEEEPQQPNTSSHHSNNEEAHRDSRAGGERMEPIERLCDVESRISYTLPLKLPRTGGGLNYLDFRGTKPEHCDESKGRRGGNSHGSSRISSSSSSSTEDEHDDNENSPSLSVLDRHPKWSKALAKMLGPIDPSAREGSQVRSVENRSHYFTGFCLSKK